MKKSVAIIAATALAVLAVPTIALANVLPAMTTTVTAEQTFGNADSSSYAAEPTAPIAVASNVSQGAIQSAVKAVAGTGFADANANGVFDNYEVIVADREAQSAAAAEAAAAADAAAAAAYDTAVYDTTTYDAPAYNQGYGCGQANCTGYSDFNDDGVCDNGGHSSGYHNGYGTGQNNGNGGNSYHNNSGRGHGGGNGGHHRGE